MKIKIAFILLFSSILAAEDSPKSQVAYTVAGYPTWSGISPEEYARHNGGLFISKKEAEEIVASLKAMTDTGSPEEISSVAAVYKNRATMLRDEADRLDKREREIAAARAVIAKWKIKLSDGP
jgi:hypothetical protein